MRKAISFIGKTILIVVATACLAVTIIPRFLDRIYYTGPESEHFDSARFFNPDGEDTVKVPSGGSRGAFLMSRIVGADGAVEWPKTVAVQPSIPRARVAGAEMTVTWVGHATVLVQTGGLNILTDPVWSNRSGPFEIGPKRVTAPGIRFNDLPQIDVVLVSHNHYDHMDLATIKRLWGRDKPLIVTSLGNDTLIRRTGAKVVALDWGGRVAAGPGVEVIATRNHHWSSRWFTDRNRALWSSFVVRLPDGNLFFAGDTGFGDGQWGVEAASYGPVRLALIPIGAFRFRPGQMDTGSHIGPIQAERIFSSLGASYAVPIHWGTFKLSDEARETPPKMLAEVIKCGGYPNRLVFSAIDIGLPVAVPAYRKPVPRLAPDPACLARKEIVGLP